MEYLKSDGNEDKKIHEINSNSASKIHKIKRIIINGFIDKISGHNFMEVWLVMIVIVRLT